MKEKKSQYQRQYRDRGKRVTYICRPFNSPIEAGRFTVVVTATIIATAIIAAAIIAAAVTTVTTRDIRSPAAIIVHPAIINRVDIAIVVVSAGVDVFSLSAP